MERHRADTRATLSLDLLEVISPECQLIVKCHDRACEQCVKKGGAGYVVTLNDLHKMASAGARKRRSSLP